MRDFAPVVITRRVEHLPGQHDQKTHGRRKKAGHGKDGERETEKERDARIAREHAEKARKTLANVAERYANLPEVSFSEATPQQFLDAQVGMKRPDYLTHYSREELEEMVSAGTRLMVSEDGKTGYLLRADGYLSGLFNNGGQKGQGVSALVDAIENGGETLDAFDHFLPRLYHHFGFEEYNRMTFADEYAPTGWPYDKLGRPDVVEMRYRKGAPRSRHQIMKAVGTYGPYSGDEDMDHDKSKPDDKRQENHDHDHDHDHDHELVGLSHAGRMVHGLPPKEFHYDFDDVQDAFESMF